MPTYEYACKTCGEHLEVVQSFKDEPLTECPACGGTLRKVFGSIGIAFKGSGFYKTDSRSSASGAPAKKGEATAGETGSKPDSGSKSESGAAKSSDSSSAPSSPTPSAAAS